MAKYATVKKFQFVGLTEYTDRLKQLGDKTEAVIGRAIYVGAGIVADAVKRNINGLPVVKSRKATAEDPIDGITAVQKQGLQQGFGISKISNDRGFINVKLGFDGYNRTKTKKFPRGQPNALIARAVESGTTLRKKQPFIAPAVRGSRKRAEAAMRETLDQEIAKIME